MGERIDVANWMVWRMARHVRAGDVVVVGVNTPLAMCAAMVGRELTPTARVVIGGAVDPQPHDMSETLRDPDSLPGRSGGVLGQAALIDHVQRGTFTLQFVSPAQIDAAGRINTVHVADRWLAGPLAIPDVAACVGRVVAYRAEHSTRIFVDAVDHVTGAGPDGPAGAWRDDRGVRGHGLCAAITSRAELAWTTAGWSVVSMPRLTDIADVRRATSFPVGAADPTDAEPTNAEPPGEFWAALERIDPGGVRVSEVPA